MFCTARTNLRVSGGSRDLIWRIFSSSEKEVSGKNSSQQPQNSSKDSTAGLNEGHLILKVSDERDGLFLDWLEEERGFVCALVAVCAVPNIPRRTAASVASTAALVAGSFRSMDGGMNERGDVEGPGRGGGGAADVGGAVADGMEYGPGDGGRYPGGGRNPGGGREKMTRGETDDVDVGAEEEEEEDGSGVVVDAGGDEEPEGRRGGIEGDVEEDIGRKEAVAAAAMAAAAAAAAAEETSSSERDGSMSGPIG